MNSPSERPASGKATLRGRWTSIRANSARSSLSKCAPPRSLSKARFASCGNLHTRVELVCARCLDTVIEEISRDFDLFYRPMTTISRDDELQLNLDDTEMAFFEGDGLFLADVLAEQVNLALPMKVICPSDCRGSVPALRREPEQ